MFHKHLLFKCVFQARVVTCCLLLWYNNYNFFYFFLQQILILTSAVLGSVLPSVICDNTHRITKSLPKHLNASTIISLSKKNRNWAVSEYVRQWTCRSEPTWRDLGSGHYPQFIQEVRCTTGPCWYGHFSCMPQYYTVRVLSNRWEETDDTVSSIPGLQNWKLVGVRATVGCICSIQ